MRVAEPLRHLIGPLELIHERAGLPLLTLTRLGVFALWIAKLLLDPLWRLSEMPREMFQPIGVLNLFSPAAQQGLLAPSTLATLWCTTLAVLTGCLFTRRPRGFALLSTVAALFLTVYSSLIRSFGPAVHTDIVLLLAVYALAGFAWADLFAPKNPGRAAYPLVTIGAMLCLSYSLVGLNRAVRRRDRRFYRGHDGVVDDRCESARLLF